MLLKYYLYIHQILPEGLPAVVVEQAQRPAGVPDRDTQFPGVQQQDSRPG
jgi:hypothetical protein